MSAIVESIFIGAPLETVWQLYDDPERLRRWAPSVLEARVLGGGAKRVGARVEVVLKVAGLKQRLVEEVVRYDPPIGSAQRGRSPGMVYEMSISLRRERPGTRCYYSCAPRYEGPLRLLAPLMNVMNRRMLRSALRSLKTAAENVSEQAAA